MCVTRGVFYFKDQAFPFHSYGAPSPDLVHRERRLSPAHFSTLPRVQVFNKASLKGREIFGGRWAKGVAAEKALIPALFRWFGISLAPRCTVRHARALAQSYQAKSCLNPK